jgi:hypothetical protein
MGIYFNSTNDKDAELLQKGIDTGELKLHSIFPNFCIYYKNHKLWETCRDGNINIKNCGTGKLTRMGEIWLINKNHSVTY